MKTMKKKVLIAVTQPTLMIVLLFTERESLCRYNIKLVYHITDVCLFNNQSHTTSYLHTFTGSLLCVIDN